MCLLVIFLVLVTMVKKVPHTIPKAFDHFADLPQELC